MDTLRELFAHNDWARDKLLGLAAGLSDEQLDRPLEMGKGSLRSTLHHLWAAERIWLDRWLEKPQPKFIEPEPGLPIAALAERWRTTAGEREALLERLDPDGGGRRITFTNTKGETYTFPLGDMLLHVSNHGVHHRAQALNMLRHCAVKPPGLDYLFFRLEQPTVEYETAAREQVRAWGFAMSERPAPPARFDLDTMGEYFRYGDWAFECVRSVAERLGDEQLDQRFEMGVGTLRRTLLHIRDAEQWWYDNWTAGPRPFAKLPETTSLAELKQRFAETATARNRYLDGLSDEQLQRAVAAEIRGTRLSFRLGESLLQLCGHGTHHRAQALNMLRRLGAETPGLDYILWFRDHAK